MGTLHFIARAQLRRVFRSCAAHLIVNLQTPGVEVPAYCYKGVPFTAVNVGPQLLPKQNVRMEEDALRFTMNKGATQRGPGTNFEATIPWQAIVRVLELPRPPDGGQPAGGDVILMARAA